MESLLKNGSQHTKLIENLELAKATYALVAMANVNTLVATYGGMHNEIRWHIAAVLEEILQQHIF